MAERNTSNIQSIDRALVVLDRLLVQEELSISEICEETGLSFSTVRRIFLGLEARGYIEKNARTKNFRIGNKLFQLGNAYIARFDVAKVAQPIMVEMRDACKETVNLSVLSNWHRVSIAVQLGTLSLIHMPPFGVPQPIWAGGSSKVLLAYSPQSVTASALKNSGWMESHSHRELLDFYEELGQVRACGYAVSHSEMRNEITSVAVPVFDPHNELAAALAIGFSSRSYTSERQEELLRLLYDGSKRITQSY